MNTKSAVPESLLRMVHCNCSSPTGHHSAFAKDINPYKQALLVEQNDDDDL